MRTARPLVIIPVLALAASLAGANAPPTLRTVKELSTALALEMAQTAIANCASKGARVAVTIVDRTGFTRLILTADGASPLGVETSRRKAHTAAAIGLSTAELSKVFAAQPQLAATFAAIDADLLAVAGGLPIKAGDEIIGGIGVGGAHESAADESCALAAVDKVEDRLK